MALPVTLPEVADQTKDLKNAGDIDQLCINTIRTLAMDAVQQANSGHPGTPMAMAPVDGPVRLHAGTDRRRGARDAGPDARPALTGGRDADRHDRTRSDGREHGAPAAPRRPRLRGAQPLAG